MRSVSSRRPRTCVCESLMGTPAREHEAGVSFGRHLEDEASVRDGQGRFPRTAKCRLSTGCG